jgi:hypothetical protein
MRIEKSPLSSPTPKPMLSQKWLFFLKKDEASENLMFFNLFFFLGHVECGQNALQGPNSMMSGEAHVNLRGL